MIISEKKVKINNPESVFKIIRSLIDSQKGEEYQEHFYSIGLNNKNVIQFVELVSLGTADSALVHPRDVFRTAIMKNCCGVIVAHNHPSGIKIPSTEDLRATKRLRESGEIVGIPLLDHIIIVKNEFYSFKENGVLN